MSYIKKCDKCGKRISMREMKQGHWVAFEVNTNKPHKHSKSKSKMKKNIQEFSTNGSEYSISNKSSKSDGYHSTVILIALGLVVLYFLFAT